MALNTIKIIGILLVVLVSSNTAAYASDISFEEVSATAGINHVGESKGSAWGDMNGDGWPDLWVTNRYDFFQLYTNNGDGTFSDESALVVATTHAAYGAAWADFDNDGDMDVFSMGPGQSGIGEGVPNVFLVNEGGLLKDKAASYGVDYRSGRGRTPLWFDWNNDGRLDLLLANEARPDGETPTALFTQGDDSFVNTTFESAVSAEPSVFAQLGRLAPGTPPHVFLNWSSYPQAIYDFSELPFQDRKDSWNFPTDVHVGDIVIGDFNGDLLTDFFYSRANRRAFAAEQIEPHRIAASIKVNQNQRAIRFKSTGEVTFGIFGTFLSPEEVFVGSDGTHPDALEFTLSGEDPSTDGIYPHEPGIQTGIFIGHESTSGYWEIQLSAPVLTIRNFIIFAENEISDLSTIGFESFDGAETDRLFFQTSEGFIDATTLAGLEEPTPCGSAVAGDFDNDMDLDIYIVCQSPIANRPNRLYENLGDGSFRVVPEAGGALGSPEGRGENVTTADFDQDGFLDLFVTNGEGSAPFNNGPHQLFRNRGNHNHWIEVDLVGIRTNRDGVGAQLIATAGGVTQVREQNAGMHRYSQNHQRLHFGLGNSAMVETLTVLWPSGVVQEIHRLPVDQIIQVFEPTYSSALGKPEYSPGQVSGVYIWKETFDGPYYLRVSGNGPKSIFTVDVLADRPFTSVEPISLEANDKLFWSDNHLNFTSTVTVGQDGIDFVLPPGTEALIAVDLNGQPNPRQLHVGGLGQPLTPTGWILEMEQLPPIPDFQPGKELGLFLGIGLSNDLIISRWNGDGRVHTAEMKVLSSSLFNDVRPVSFESCCDSLIQDEKHIMASATMSTGWDGLDIQVPASAAIGITYKQDGLFQSQRVNGGHGVFGRPNAYILPISGVGGDPTYNPSEDKGLFIWKGGPGLWRLRVTAGGDHGRFQGAVTSSLSIHSITAVKLESNDILQMSPDQKRIEFDLKVWGSAQDGVDIVLPEGAKVSLELNDNTAEASHIVKVGGERWSIESLPVVLSR